MSKSPYEPRRLTADGKQKQTGMMIYIRKLRQEIIDLEREVGGLCEKVTKLEAELKLLRKE